MNDLARRRYELIKAIADHAKGWLRFSRTYEKTPDTKQINAAIDALIEAAKKQPGSDNQT